MNDLSPRARELIQVGRDEVDPTSADKDRIREVLRNRLPPLPPPDAAGGPEAIKVTAQGATSWPLVSALTVGAGVVLGALYWGLSTENGAAHLSPAVTANLAVSATTDEPSAELAPSGASTPFVESPTAPATSDPPRSAPTTSPESSVREKPPSTRLGEEVELLSRATTALHAGRGEEALQALAEHQRKFPRGSLSLERRAARAQALCLLGRKTEAERDLRQLPASSPQAARAREFCDAK
jgi:hypothetical protein